MIAPHRSARKLKTVVIYADTNAAGLSNGSLPAPMEAAVPDSLEVLRHQLPGVCPARIDRHAPQTILRQVLVDCNV